MVDWRTDFARLVGFIFLVQGRFHWFCFTLLKSTSRFERPYWLELDNGCFNCRHHSCAEDWVAPRIMHSGPIHRDEHFCWAFKTHGCEKESYPPLWRAFFGRATRLQRFPSTSVLVYHSLRLPLPKVFKLWQRGLGQFVATNTYGTTRATANISISERCQESWASTTFWLHVLT